MSDLELQSQKPLREVVYERLKQEILEGKIRPGTRMMEVQLAEELDVSRTPVRDAIRKLAKDGLVIIEPRRGAYASEISVNDIQDTLTVRETLESLAASLTAEKVTQDETRLLTRLTNRYREAVERGNIDEMIALDEKFHQTIVGFSRNKTLIRLTGTIEELSRRFRYLYYGDFRTYQHQPDEHAEIVDAIASGDGEKAGCAAKEHIERLKEYLNETGIWYEKSWRR